jgi:alkanesulfonate monooxygenase SsuD/methylene tetrahydromethanopterin reductase-like flavin-dependent oxidoreductase (luciferase family)
MNLPNLGIAIRALDVDPSNFIDPIRAAEEAGFKSVWLVEVNDIDAIAFASALSMVTNKIEICRGVVNSSLRLPTLLAMGAATVSNFSRGRFVLGIGAGSSPMKKSDDTTDTRLTRLRETLQLLRSLLSGAKTSFQGSLFEIQDFQLEFKPKYSIPLFGAAMGLRMIRIVAELADGVVLMLPTAEYAKLAIDTVQSTIKKRSISQFRIACHFVTVISEEEKGEENNNNNQSMVEARQTVARFCAISPYRNSFARMGFNQEIAEIDKALRTDPMEAWRSVPPKMADQLIIHGTVEECVKKISDYVDLGITDPIIYPSFANGVQKSSLERVIREFSRYF